MTIWEKCRAETPGCKHRIHFNNAGASLIAQPVLDKVQTYLQTEALNGGYETERLYAETLAEVYPAAAQLINAQPSEIALMPNATTAWNRAFYAIPWQKGDRILCSPIEYSSNFMAYLQLKQRLDIEIDLMPYNEDLQPDLAAAEALISPQTRLLSLSYLPSHIGLVQDAEAFGRLARHYGIYYLLDACQAVGQISIDVEKIGCDFLSVTGRKYLRAPRGTGFLYVRQSRLEGLEPCFMDTAAAEWQTSQSYQLRQDARRLESWEANRANQLGLAEAINYANRLGLANIQARINQLADYLKFILRKLPEVRLSETKSSQSGIVSFDIVGKDLAQIQKHLETKQINTSLVLPSVSRIDLKQRGFARLLRASVHYYNTEAEIEQFGESLEQIIWQN